MVRVVSRSLAVAIVVGVTVGGAAGTAQAATTSGLASGARLASGQMLTSPGGLYSLTMQTDGNLVERTTKRAGAVWSTNTVGRPGATLTMQTDGNLVLRATSGVAAWATNTPGNPGATLRIQDDGNIVVAAASGRALWSKGVDKPPAPQPSGVLRVGQSWTDQEADHHSASGEFSLALITGSAHLAETIHPGGINTTVYTWEAPGTGAATGATRLTLQTDGNLVLYVGGRAAWTTSTSGRGAAYFILQDDGNMVLRSTSGGTLWSSSTGKKVLSSGATLASGQRLIDVVAATYRIRAAATMQVDGNFVFSRDARAVWSSNTHVAGSHLVVQTDGNMVIVAPDGHAVWSTATAGTGNANYLFLDYDSPLALNRATDGGAVWTSS